jgi:SAM-dependent methyltransferase
MATTAHPTGESTAKPPHLRIAEPSSWVRRFTHLVPAGATVLDIATGGGRHARLFSARGCLVTAVDRTLDHVADLAADRRVELLRHDLENGSRWPFAGRTFDCVVVTFYLHRPLLSALIDCVGPGGVLLYESLADDPDRGASRSHPDRWLREGELLDIVRGHLQIVAYEHGRMRSPFPGRPHPGVVQRICALRGAAADGRPAARCPYLSPDDRD